MSTFPLYQLLHDNLKIQSIVQPTVTEKKHMVEYISHSMDKDSQTILFTLIRRHQLLVDDGHKFANPFKSEKTQDLPADTFKFNLKHLPLTLILMIKQFCTLHHDNRNSLYSQQEQTLNVSI